MSALSEILRRFRSHGVPGAPSVIAVPADRATEAAHELDPVFAALQPAQRLSREVVSAAESEALRRRARAHEQARQLLEGARSGAAAARAQAAASRLEAGEAECNRVLAEGRLEAERMARRAEERMPALVDQVVSRVLALAPPPRGAPR